MCTSITRITCLIVIQIILYIYKSKLRKQLKQKEYLAKVVEERTIELRIQRDQVLNESKKLSDALDALAKAQDELVRKVGTPAKSFTPPPANPLIALLKSEAYAQVKAAKSVEGKQERADAVAAVKQQWKDRLFPDGA